MSDVKLAPSILAADFTRLSQQVTEATQAGADRIHVDVMDGHFAPNLSMGPAIVQSLRRVSGMRRGGKQVPVAETLRGFKEILDGKHDAVAESDFYMKGGIDGPHRNHRPPRRHPDQPRDSGRPHRRGESEEARQRAEARLHERLSAEEVATVSASLARSLAQLRVKRRRRV